MLRLVISNQKGGVAKTTTTLTLARFFAEQGRRVLVVDTDPQGCVGLALGIRSEYFLAHLLVRQHSFDICVQRVLDNLDLLPGSRDTIQAESMLLNAPAREYSFRILFEEIEKSYDVVLVDCAPSINMMQTCALVYAQRILIPVSMDVLAVHGAVACMETSKVMNRIYRDTDIRTVAFLPVMVDRRFQMTTQTMEFLSGYSETHGIPVLPSIRTDQSVARAARSRKFLADYDPKCKAYEDYLAAAQALCGVLNVDSRCEENTPLQATA